MKKAIISKAIAFGLTALERRLPATTKAFSGFLALLVRFPERLEFHLESKRARRLEVARIGWSPNALSSEAEGRQNG